MECKTFCGDCLKKQEDCRGNPIECMRKQDAELYFKMQNYILRFMTWGGKNER